MLLSGVFLGKSFTNYIQPLPVASIYNKITFYGNNIIDDIHVQSRLYSDTEVQALLINDVPPWDGYTIMLSQFNQSNLQAGNVVSLDSSITNWNIYRKAMDEEISKNLATIDVGTTQYMDYTAQANKTYVYDIFPQTATQIGEPLETADILADFYGVYLIDIDTSEVYMFDLNLTTSDVTTEVDITTYKGFSKYSGYTVGDRNYFKASVTSYAGLLEGEDGSFTSDISYIDDLKAFINNGKEKLFKFKSGQMLKVKTMNFKYKYTDDIPKLQPFQMTFDIEECGAL